MESWGNSELWSLRVRTRLDLFEDVRYNIKGLLVPLRPHLDGTEKKTLWRECKCGQHQVQPT